MAEAEKFGIKETKEALHFLFGLAQASINAAADGKFGIDDVAGLLSTVTSLPAAINGVQNIGKEIADLSAAEKDELYKMMEQELKIPHAMADMVLKKVWKIVLEFADFTRLLK